MICLICYQPKPLRHQHRVCTDCLKKLDRELHGAAKEVTALEAQWVKA